MGMLQWAENEVKLACEREAPNRKEGEWDYGCACYLSALKAYKSLENDGHSGMSWSFTKQILMRLMDGKPLTPIYDTPDVWNTENEHLIYRDDVDGYTSYQCKRMSSLFKTVYDDGRVTYSDNDRQYGVDMDYPNSPYSSGTVTQYIDEHYPITMPYTADDKYKMVCDDYDSVNNEPGCFDHVALLELYKNGKKVEDFEPVYIDYTNMPSVRYITKEEYFAKRPKKRMTEVDKNPMRKDD